MANCPKCDTPVFVKTSDHLECPGCKNKLVASYSPAAKALFMLIIFIEGIASIVTVVIAGSIDSPALQKWLVAGPILLGLTVVSVLLLLFVANKLVLFRLKETDPVK
jgi:hypothetical protein